MSVIWANKRIVPQANLDIWLNTDDKTASGAASSVTDFSGNGRNAVTLAGEAAYSTDILNGNGGVHFDGFVNPLQYTGALSPKHIFILASYDNATFTGYDGLLSGLTTYGLLVGGSAGTTKFTDFSGEIGSYVYRIQDVALAYSNQIAPVGGKVALIELVIPAGITLTGLQIGRDRTDGTRKWRGYFFELLAYSAIKDDYARYEIYKYIALKYHVWQQSAEGLNIFPFPANHSRSKSIGRVFYQSKPYSGASTNLLRGSRFSTIDADFQLRKQEEMTATVDFHAEHYAIQDFVFRDWKYYPPKDSTVEFTSDLKDSGGENRLFNYGFSMKGTATPTAPANSFGISLVDDEDVFLIEG